MTADRSQLLRDLTRRRFLEAAAGTGALLSLPGHLHADPGDQKAAERKRPGRRPRPRTFFLNLSHEDFVGHAYFLVGGGLRHPLRELGRNDPALEQARRSNRFLTRVSDYQVTHVIENAMLPANGMVLSYLLKDPDTTTGEWQMSAVYLFPPLTSYTSAYARHRQRLGTEATLPLSAKRRKYGLPPAVSLRDLVEEQSLLDTTDWATALVNLHPEMVSADPDSAAYIQTTYIGPAPATFTLSEALGAAGPASPQQGTGDNQKGWATLVPYRDDNSNPLLSTRGKNVGLILYDPKWHPTNTVPSVKLAMQPALQAVKDDPTLGVDVTASPSAVPGGAIWTRNDGVTSIAQAPTRVGRRGAAADAQYTLTNITPLFAGYSCTATTTGNGANAMVTLNFKNWYVRYLGLFIQFYSAGPNNQDVVVPISSLPPGLVPTDSYTTPNNELLIGSLTPEFTIYGIPIEPGANSFSFTFPSAVATSARILASGLGIGSHTAQDTEILGIVMTSLFNLIIPAGLIALGIATDIDAFVKALAIPFALLVAKEVAIAALDGTSAQIAGIFWKAFVKGATGPALKAFLTAFFEFLGPAEAVSALEDAIPIAGEIIQALGVLGATAEILETTLETTSSPWTYQYKLVATYDLTLTISPDSKDPNGFPASAATYKVSATFDGGAAYTQTLPVTSGASMLSATFQGVPLGGNVVLTVGFYTLDNSSVGHGTTGSILNVPASAPAITITETRLPITASTVYQHKQKTALDDQGNHLWLCASAPAPPSSVNNCADAPGNLCELRSITASTTLGNVGYAWNSYSSNACVMGGSGLLDQLASIPGENSGANAQAGYASLPCALAGQSAFVYDPLGRPGLNFYFDPSDNINILRRVTLQPTVFTDPRCQSTQPCDNAWGKFNLSADDLLLHPSGAVITINSASNKLESLKIPSAPVTDAEAAVSLIADSHGGLGSRPGLFTRPTVATITADGVILILESGNNRIHAVDVAGNPVRHFPSQPVPYFLNLTATGGENTTYLDIAAEYSGLIYVLSLSNGVYRLDIYPADLTGSAPLSTTLGFNAGKVTVDYWRNVYSLNFEVLMSNGSLPASGVTEPSISQWLPTRPPACEPRSTDKVLPGSPVSLPRQRRFLRWPFGRSQPA